MFLKNVRFNRGEKTIHDKLIQHAEYLKASSPLRGELASFDCHSAFQRRSVESLAARFTRLQDLAEPNLLR